MLKTFKVRRGCTVPRPLTWPTTTKFDGTKGFAKTGFSDLPKTQFVGTCLRVDTTWIFICGGIPLPLGELPERVQSLPSHRL